MTDKQKAIYIQRVLGQLYPEPQPPLSHKDPYTLLIAVLLSARCTDKKVNEITPLLFKKADTPKKMVQLEISEIKKIIQPCGLSPQKSNGIFHLSKKIIEEHNNQVPASFEALESFPAVGHKTASVVMSQAFGVPAFPVDTHIYRLARKWKVTKSKNLATTEKDLKELFPKKHWNHLHLQMIFYGREYCNRWKCNTSLCRICSHLEKSK